MLAIVATQLLDSRVRYSTSSDRDACVLLRSQIVSPKVYIPGSDWSYTKNVGVALHAAEGNTIRSSFAPRFASITNAIGGRNRGVARGCALSLWRRCGVVNVCANVFAAATLTVVVVV